MTQSWSIKSIKHWEDGTWDALILKTTDGRRTYDRCLSQDGFHWKNKYGRNVPDDVQSELTSCIGDMETQGIRTVVF